MAPRRRAARSVAARALLVLMLLGLLVPVAAYLLLRASLPQLHGTVEVVGLQGPVSIERDARGVPTVHAGSRVDLARATGFLHGQERFFAMDLMRRDAAGELSALVGAATLEHDRRRRLHGMRVVAEQAFVDLPAARRAQLEAYASGVNAGLAALHAWPFEYLLLRQAPLPWAPEDTLLVVHAMWFTLSDERAERDLSVTRLARHLPEAVVRLLSPPGTPLDAPLDGSELPVAPLPGPEVLDLRARLSAAAPSAPPRPAASLTAAEAAWLRGSNAFALGGARSVHGGALLANDMHLTLRVPNIWYRMRLVSADPRGGFDITGVTLPGAPAIVAGSNGALAWGFTNAYADVSDRVRLEPTGDAGAQYLTVDGARDFVSREERIEVAGAAPVLQRYRDSLWGPVVEADGELHALRWLAHAPAASNVALMRVEQARSVEQGLALLAEAGMPAQNLLLADAAGAIAWTVIGRLPRRAAGVDGGRVLDWQAAGDGRWQWLPREQVPVQRGAREGLLWSANARSVGGAALAVLGDGGHELGARATQIRDALRALPVPAAEADLLGIALDDRALFLARWYDLLQRVVAGAAAAEPRAAELGALLQRWSGRAVPDDAAYRWVRVFRDGVHDLVLEPFVAPLAAQAGQAAASLPGLRQLEGPVWRLLQERPMHLLHPRFADWDALLVAAVRAMLASHRGPLAERTWGRDNAVVIRHPLSGALPGLGRLLDMPRLALPGDAHVPRVQRGTLGASQRLVVAPGREAQALFHMPGGQSGHPLSAHYRDGHRDWAEGRPSPLLPGPVQHRLRLLPARLVSPDG